MSALPGVRDFDCPFCGSVSGKECVTSGGNVAEIHRARFGLRSARVYGGMEFVVRILDDDDHVGVKGGERYVGTKYPYDAKVTLLRRIPDGFNPECNQYTHNVEFVGFDVEGESK